MTDLTAFTELVQQKEEIGKRLRAQAKDAFREQSKEILDRYPAIAEFGWHQYTPYFNDGEPCVFGRGGIAIIATEEPTLLEIEDEDLRAEALEEMRRDEGYGGTFAGWGQENQNLRRTYFQRKKDGYKLYWDELGKYHTPEDYEGPIDNPDYDPTLGDPYNAVMDFVKLFDDDLLLFMFGDHVEIRVSRDGVETTEYDHD